MAAQIRQEISILTHALAGAVTSNEFVQLDTTQYNGTVTYYFEIVAAISAGSAAVTLRDKGDSSDDASITVTGATQTLYRSTAFTPTAGQTNYAVVSAANVTVKSARIVIIQNATTLTNTETQIEIGNYNLARTTESAIALVNPKYWLYTAANWDGTKTFYAEAVYDSGDMDTVTISIQTSTSITAPSWSSVATIVSAATTTTPTRTSVAFTPVDGQWYTIFSLNGSMDNHDIYRAGVVVQQNEGVYITGVYGNDDPFGQAAGNVDKLAQSFKLGVADTLTGVNLKLKKTGTPTDNIVATIRSTLDGTVLATASVAGSSLTTSNAVYTFTFASSYTVTANAVYYLQLERDSTTSNVNYYNWNLSTSGTYPNGARQSHINGGAWGEDVVSDFYFELLGVSTITKLEPQYLLANTLLAAGTALQTFLTEWDSTEWDDGAGSIAYYFQGEAANGSTSDMTLQEADGGGAVTNSTLTNIDNAQISAAMTMPTDQNLDVIANANAGDVAAARILVAYTFSSSPPPIASGIYNGNQFFQLLGTGT